MSAAPKYAPCAWCGKTVPRHAKQYGIFPAGTPNVSLSMSHQIDKTGIFCTMRCAARYAVSVAIAAERAK